MRNLHQQKKNWNRTLLAGLVAASLPVTAIQASGFRIPEVSVAGTAASNALVATTDDLGSVPYNPASISFHKGNAALLGVNHITYEATVTTDATFEGDGDDSFFVPNMMLSAVGDNNWAFAMLINAPFGLETSWPDSTFPGFADIDALEPGLSRIEMLNFNPNLSYKIDDSSSFSFGLTYYDVRDLRLNTQAVKISGSGYGTGWNIGYLKKLGAVSVGASYRSAVKTDIKGTFDSTALGPPNGPFFLGASAKLEFPDIFQLGIHFQATDSFGIEFDVDRTGWSSFDEIKVTNSTGGTFGSPSYNNWKDSWAYRLGFAYKFNQDNKLMFGYSYDESPQPDSHFSARVPDADRQLLSIGASHTFAGSWTLQYAYMHVMVDDRTVNSTTTYIPGTTPDPNGTTAYNGEYESKVDIIGISISKTF